MTTSDGALDSATRLLDRLASEARRSGRSHLLEHDAMSVVRELGLSTPRSIVVGGPAEALGADLSLFGGDPEVVIKVVVDDLIHKSDVGGVAVVAANGRAVSDAIRRMANRFSDRPVRSFSINRRIEFDPTIGGELLVGMRWTEEFGAVVTLAPGGLHAELLGRYLRPSGAVAVISSATGLDPASRRLLHRTLAVRLAAHSQRGRAPRISPESLDELIETLLTAAGAWVPDIVDELEINPLVLTETGPIALDAVVRLGRGKAVSRPPRPLHKLNALLRPQSIAVVGVSRRPNPGRIIVENILADGFDPAGVTIVKPGVEEMLGCCCVPNLAALDSPVDLLVLAVAAARAGELVEQVVADRQAESIILIPGGLGERRGSEARAEAIRSAVDRSRGTDEPEGPVINGGNCLGVRSTPGRFNTLFLPRHKLRFPAIEPAPLAILSQSGAFAAAVASRLDWLNPRYIVSIGNQIDLTVGDYLEHLETDENLRVIGCYVEGFQPLDGRRWLEAARRLTDRGSTIVLYRAGRSAAGARATATHTASVAGDYVVTRELARAAGVVVADSLDDFSALLGLACHLGPRVVSGRRLAAVSNAGFECVAMADASQGFELPPFGDATETVLSDLLHAARIDEVVGVSNPLDLTPIVDDALFERAVRAALADSAIDLGIVGCVPLTGALQTLPAADGYAEDIADAGGLGRRLAQLWADTSKGWVAVVDSGATFDPFARLLQGSGIPTFRSADRAMRLLRIYCAHRLPGLDDSPQLDARAT